MKDERIQTTVNRFATIGFLIWYFLLLISLCYRMLLLKQHFREYWDIFAIFSIGTCFVFIAYANKGIFDHDFKRRWLIICIVNLIIFFTVFFIISRTYSIVHVGGMLIVFLLGMGSVIAISYFLNRRWKRKEGIEDEK